MYIQILTCGRDGKPGQRNFNCQWNSMENWIGTKIQPFVPDIAHQPFLDIYKRFNVQGSWHSLTMLPTMVEPLPLLQDSWTTLSVEPGKRHQYPVFLFRITWRVLTSIITTRWKSVKIINRQELNTKSAFNWERYTRYIQKQFFY